MVPGNLNLITELRVLDFFSKHCPMPRPVANTYNVRPWKAKGKNKKKKKNATQQPAFIAKSIEVRSQTGPMLQPPGPMANQPRPPAPQSFQTPHSFQAPHHQQEMLIDLTDDNAPVTPLASSGWKPLDVAGNATSQSNPPNKRMQSNLDRCLKLPENFQKTLQKKAELQKSNRISHARIRNKYAWINSNKLQNFQNAATSSGEQGEREIKWEVNLVDDSDDEKNTESTSQQGMAPTIGTQMPQSQAPVQGLTSETVIQKQSPSEDPGTSSSAGRALVGVQNVKTRPQWTSVEPRPPQPLSRLAKAHPAGIPKSFLTPAHLSRIYGGMQPQPSAVKSGANWTPNPAPYEPPESAPMYVQTNVPSETPQQYSPSDAYDDSVILQRDPEEGSESSSQAAQKRLSAFQRLGPVTQPKKPKLTINILFNKDQEGRNQAVREVVDLSVPEEKYVPVHLRPEVVGSKDETVARYLPLWPWKRTIFVRKSVTHRNSKSVMILEQEQMEEAYDKEHAFFQMSVRGYPAHWRKEDVLDVMMDSVRGKSFIPCFIEFSPEECKFLIIRCRWALAAIHKLGFLVRKDEVELAVTIHQIDLTINHVDFVPRLVLRKRLSMVYDGERKLNLKEFCIKPDISHFIYFPLSRLTNQTELVQLQSTVAWNYLTDLDLSHNRLTSIDGFDLPKTTPKLKHLDLSFNCIERVTTLLRCRELALRSLKLEGNPLCHDYTDPQHYVRVIKMIFSGLVEIDDLPIRLKGDLPEFRKNYCPEDAVAVAERFLEVFFPLLDLPAEERLRIEGLYDEKAVLTVTYRYTLRYSPFYRYLRSLFLRARAFVDGESDAVEGAPAIAKLVAKWPPLQHDPYTFTADVMHHTETHTILRVSGILKLTSESLAEDEHLLAFTRTLVLSTANSTEYKIMNEMLYWDDATTVCAYNAFQINSVRFKKLSLKFESTPDEDLQGKITEIFMKLTDLEKSASIRCLEMQDWNLKSALEHFIKLLKLNDLDSLRIREK